MMFDACTGLSLVCIGVDSTNPEARSADTCQSRLARMLILASDSLVDALSRMSWSRARKAARTEAAGWGWSQRTELRSESQDRTGWVGAA